MIQRYKQSEPNYAEWEQWGYDILVTGVFAIIICGTLGLIAIHFLAPRLLLPADPDHEAAEGSHIGDDELNRNGDTARAAGGDTKRASEMVVQRTRSLPIVPSEPPLRRPAHDYELVALYIDTIRQLTTAATATDVDQKEVQRLSDAVMAIQSVRNDACGRRSDAGVRRSTLRCHVCALALGASRCSVCGTAQLAILRGHAPHPRALSLPFFSATENRVGRGSPRLDRARAVQNRRVHGQ